MFSGFYITLERTSLPQDDKKKRFVFPLVFLWRYICLIKYLTYQNLILDDVGEDFKQIPTSSE